jgi:alkanesulfonate monooxygenase SsuD/methylene tetrahydromethanopterin reductase-like flavin-dependent oxidoreductase (luciferase family)
MKTGVLQFFSWPDRSRPLEQVYARALERIEIMEATGYDAVWLAEHHFTGYSVCPSVHQMGTYVAARTQRLRIGTAVTLAALAHPLRIAEEVALLDVLSGGRVNWGAGRGFEAREFDAFAVPMAESSDRFREAVEIVLAAWTQETISFDGRFHRFTDVEVLPKPAQRPHPPSWVAATSEPAIAWAASKGLSILMDPHSPHAEIARKREFYRVALEAAGFAFAGRELPMARLLAVAETASEAEEIARRGARWTLGAYMKGEQLAQFAPGTPSRDPVDHYVSEVVIHGTPEAVRDQLEKLRSEMFLSYLLIAPLSEGSFRLFTEQVLPHLGAPGEKPG